MNATQADYVVELARRLREARRGEKKALIEEGRRMMGEISVAEMYRRITEVAVAGPARKTRSDAGRSRVKKEELQAVAGLVRHAAKANGRQTMTIEGAIEVARANGLVQADLAPNTFARHLWRNGLHPKQLRQPTAHQPLASRHPNHVWQVDASTCVLYYLADDRLGVMEEEAFNKNKLGNLFGIKEKLVTRYAITDHFSGMFYLRYVLGGESTENLLTAMIETMLPRERDAMHGIPFLVGMDPGMANTSRIFSVFLRNLGVEALVHEPRNARAKGSVERTHRIIEEGFESRLAFSAVKIDSLSSLQAEADIWRRAYCGRVAHSRHGRPRAEMWSTIDAALHLRAAPPRRVLWEAATSDPKGVPVKGDLTIAFKGERYNVRHIPFAAVNAMLEVSTNPSRFPDTVNIHGEDGRIWLAERVEFDEASGFRKDAAVIGEEFKSMPDSEIDRNRKAIDLEAFPDGKRPGRKSTPYQGQIDPMADVREAVVPGVPCRLGLLHEVVVPEVVRVARAKVGPVVLSEREAAAAQRMLENMEKKNRPVLLDGAGRPLFDDDVDLIRWLVAHPEKVLPEDREWLKNKLRSAATRTLLDAEGMDLDQIRALVA